MHVSAIQKIQHHPGEKGKISLN